MDKRIIKVRRGDEWTLTEMKLLKKGDWFKLYESSDEQVKSDRANGAWFATDNPIEIKGVWQISAAAKDALK